MEDRYIATVDLGTSKIALSVARISGENAEILFYREKPSDGVRYGCIYNPAKASVPLKEIIHEAEEELSIKITQVVIGVPRYGVTQETASANLDRSDAESCITQEEIDSIKEMALDSYPLSNPAEQEIYGASAQSFSTDDSMNYTESDVVGMPSAVIRGNFKIFIGVKKASRNIDIMLNKADVALARKYFLPPLTADAVLHSEEKENGVALIEMGAGVTSVSIYQGGILRFYNAIPFGGRSISNDIKMECGFTESLAENIKLGFGACMPDKLLTMGDKILQIKDEENGTDQLLPVKYLSEIITARVKEIVDAVLFQILVGLDEMTATEESAIDRERRGVRCFEHQVFAVVDDAPFLSGITAPKKEDKMLAMLRQGGNGGIRESLPTLALMAACHTCLHRESGIEQQDSLVCPMRQVAVALTVVEIILIG